MKSIYDYKAAIFDLDGTLVESMHVWENIDREFLSVRNIAYPEDLSRIIGSMRLHEAAPYIIERFNLNITSQEVIDEWLLTALTHYETSIILKDGAIELLQKLQERNIKLSIATSCFPAACEAVLQRHKIRNMFEFIVYSDDVARGKGYPDIWLESARLLDTQPKDCIVFEDFPTALDGVRAAGMGFVAIREKSFGGSFQGDWLDFASKSDFAVESLRELL
jgi:HAD superfamily hydrolase (TIGR01509 family)